MYLSLVIACMNSGITICAPSSRLFFYAKCLFFSVSVINKQNLRIHHELEETKNAKFPQIHIVKSGKTVWFLPADDLQHNSKVSVHFSLDHFSQNTIAIFICNDLYMAVLFWENIILPSFHLHTKDS